MPPGTYIFKKDGTFSFTDKSTGTTSTGTGTISPSGVIDIKSTTATPTTTTAASNASNATGSTAKKNAAVATWRGAGLAAGLAAAALLAL
jgi:hypothetical protein